jgi:prevent-host-death family protein
VAFTMSSSRWSLQDAKNSFSAVVDAARKGRPQMVTKRGRPAVVVLSVEEYERLSRVQAAETPAFADHLLAMPQDGRGFERARLALRDVEL